MYRIDIYVRCASIEKFNTVQEAILKVDEIQDEDHICRMVDMDAEGREEE